MEFAPTHAAHALSEPSLSMHVSEAEHPSPCCSPMVGW